MLLSIIVPVYNAEKYIVRCAESILADKSQDTELILVDDGSSDSSLSICSELATKDSRVRLITKPNGGVSSARNLGLLEARGEYIMFSDSDDWYSPDAFRKIRDWLKIPRESVIFCYNCTEDGRPARKNADVPECRCRIADIAENYWDMMHAGLINSVWNKIYKKSIIEKYSLRFDESIRFSEDALFNISYLRHCSSCFIYPDALYNYYIHSGQSISRLYPDYYEMLDKCFSEIEVFIRLYSKPDFKFYNEWLKVIMGSCRHQKFRLGNEEEILSNPRTSLMCEQAIPESKTEKLCLSLVNQGKLGMFCRIYSLKYFICRIKAKFWKEIT